MEIGPNEKRGNLALLVALYFIAAAAIFLIDEITGGMFFPPVLALGLGIILLYGGLAVALLSRRDVDGRQARVFGLLAVLVTATIILNPVVPGMGSPWLYGILGFLYVSVFLVNPAVIVHMAALIPGPHRVLDRRRWFLPAHYLGLLALALFLTVVLLFGTADRKIFVTANLAVCLYAGCAALILLGGAARREPSSRGRRQALMVFFGVLPWTAYILARLILPINLQSRLPLDAVEYLVIFLVPVTMFIAIIGFRMFGLELLVRRGLIYGLTLGLPFFVLVGVWLGAGVFVSRILGFEATPFQVGLVLLLIGVILRPLGRFITGAVDRVFFPEKIALKRLPRVVIGEMAASTDLDEAAVRLVGRLRNELQVRSAALLIADEEGRIFRVRALSREGHPPENPVDVIITSEDLRMCPELERGRPATRLTSADPLSKPWKTITEEIGAETVLPVSLGGPPTALICLGRPSAGGYFDRKDLDQLEILAEQAAAVIEHARVRELARIDPLTKLPRRQVALDRLQEELERGRRSGRPPAVALADLDDFKKINDTHGHPTGDRALRAVSDALRARARSMDLVARFGGEEMIVVLPECDAEGALAVCEAMRRAVRKTIFRGERGRARSVTVSIGAAVAEPRDTAERLISRADEALYRAKRTGKDRVCLAEKSRPERS